MNLGDMISHINDLSDEFHESKVVTNFINDAIAKINVECDTIFPFVSLNDSSTEYPGFTESWQRALLVPYAVGRSKQKEGSQFEYSDAYSEFMLNLMTFRSKYVVPDEYLSTNQATSFENDMSNSPYRW